MSPYLQDVAATYVEARDRLHALVDGMRDETFNAKPFEGAWSVGECVAHLNTVADEYLPAFAAVLTDDAPRGGGPFRYGWFTRRFIAANTAGSGAQRTLRAMKPPEATGLKSEIDRARALNQFDEDIDRYIALCDKADGYDLGRIKMRSPFLRIVKMPVGGYLEALGVHAIRHVAQAERAAASVGSASG